MLHRCACAYMRLIWLQPCRCSRFCCLSLLTSRSVVLNSFEALDQQPNKSNLKFEKEKPSIHNRHFGLTCIFPKQNSKKLYKTRQVLGRPVCDRGAIPRRWKTLRRTKSWQEKKKNIEANWMVSNSAKLDRRTKQHTQFGLSASNGSRDMARTKSWQKKKIK